MHKYSNFNFYFQFFHSKNDSFALLSLSKSTLETYSTGVSMTHPDNSDIFMRLPDNEALYSSLIETTYNKAIIKVEHVKNEQDLLTWILITGGHFTPQRNWEVFLSDNNLLKKWISGQLNVRVGNHYKERSKEFGQRESFNQKNITLDTRNEIWSFPDYYNGLSTERYGEYVYFHYENKVKLLKVENIPFFENEPWLCEMNQVINSFPKLMY